MPEAYRRIHAIPDALPDTVPQRSRSARPASGRRQPLSALPAAPTPGSLPARPGSRGSPASARRRGEALEAGRAAAEGRAARPEAGSPAAGGFPAGGDGDALAEWQVPRRLPIASIASARC